MIIVLFLFVINVIGCVLLILLLVRWVMIICVFVNVLVREVIVILLLFVMFFFLLLIENLFVMLFGIEKVIFLFFSGLLFLFCKVVVIYCGVVLVMVILFEGILRVRVVVFWLLIKFICWLVWELEFIEVVIL